MRLASRIGGASTLAIAAWAAIFVACATGTSDIVDLGEAGLSDDAATSGDRRGLPGLDGSTGEDSATEKDSGSGTDGATTCTKKVVLNEVRTGTSANANDEFVEIYNPNDCAVSLGDWKIKYQSAAGGNGVAGYTFGAGDSIPAKSFFLIATASFSGKKDATMTATGFGGSDGQIGLLDDKNAIVDGVGYGSITGGTYREGTAVASPPANGTIGRKSDGVDTDDNKNDWKTMTTPTPGAAN